MPAWSHWELWYSRCSVAHQSPTIALAEAVQKSYSGQAASESRRVDRPIFRAELVRRKALEPESISGQTHRRRGISRGAPIDMRVADEQRRGGRNAGARRRDAANRRDPACAGMGRRRPRSPHRRRIGRDRGPARIDRVAASGLLVSTASGARAPSAASTSAICGYGRVCFSRRVS